MKLSIFTTVGNEKTSPSARNDCYSEALESYYDLADEVVVVCGNKSFYEEHLSKDVDIVCRFGRRRSKLRGVYSHWPWEWSWEQLPIAMNCGYRACTGDWVIRCDIDYVFHEDDIGQIRYVLDNSSIFPVSMFQKYSFVTRDKFYEKGGVPIAINKKLVGDTYGFGQATNCDTDLCYPIKITGENEKGIPEGIYESDKFGKTWSPIYNYDYTGKTQEGAIEEFWRFSKAYHRYFDEWKFGGSKADSFEKFVSMMQGRYNKCIYEIGKKKEGYKVTHPKYVKEWIANLDKDQMGYNLWGEAK